LTTEQIIEFLQAVGERDYGAVKAKLEEGFKPTLPSLNGNTAMRNAAQNGDIEMAKLLVRYGAKIDEKILYVSPIDGRSFENYTPLLFCADPDMVRYLVENGADINHRDGSGLTKLMLIACTPTKEHIELAKVLIELGADKTARVDSYKGSKGPLTACGIAEYERDFLTALNKKLHSEKRDQVLRYFEDMNRVLAC